MANGAGFVTQGKKTFGDVAVDGLLAGMGAGVVMGVGLVLLGMLDGFSPLETLGRFDPANEGSAAVGGLLHLAVSGIYGVLFAVGYHLLATRRAHVKPYGWAIGVAFGLGIWLAARVFFLPGLNSALADIPPWSFALAHLAYGAGLGYLVGWHQQN